MSESYTCEACHNTFIKGQSDEDADKEYAELFPENPPRSIVCEDCFIKIMDWKEGEKKRYWKYVEKNWLNNKS